MAATKYGSGNYGLIDETTSGLYIADLSLDVSEDEVFMPNHIGEDIGLVLYNQQGTLTGSGATVTANTVGETLGGILSAIANAAIFGTDTGITKWYINSSNLRGVNRDFQTGSWTATGRSGITAATGTEIS